MTYDELLSSMHKRYRELSGFDADAASDIGIRLKVLAAETASVYEQINALKTQIFPQTSTGEHLDLHAAEKGLVRKPALRANGLITFMRETPAASDIVIPAGILCGTKPEPQLLFETGETAVLAAGTTSVQVKAAAQAGGEISNVAPGAVCVMISPAVGVTSVVNEEAFTGGLDGETDDALRNRLLLAYQNISNGTNSAFYYDLAMSHEGVLSAKVLPRRRGRGTVDVVVACGKQSPGDKIAEEIAEDLTVKKEINVDVLVLAAKEDLLAVSAEIAPRDGYSYDAVAENARAVIRGYLNGLQVGEPFLLATLGSKLMACDGVYNYRIILPSNDRIALQDHVLRPGEITAGRMAVG